MSMNYEIIFTAIGPTKIQGIKGIRLVTGLGLKEAKDIADALQEGLEQIRPQGPVPSGEEAIRCLAEYGVSAHYRPRRVDAEGLSAVLTFLNQLPDQITVGDVKAILAAL